MPSSSAALSFSTPIYHPISEDLHHGSVSVFFKGKLQHFGEQNKICCAGKYLNPKTYFYLLVYGISMVTVIILSIIKGLLFLQRQD